MKPISSDLRRRIIEIIQENEETQPEIAERFAVSLSFVEKLWHRFRSTGSYEALASGGGRERLLKDEEELIRAEVKTRPDITLVDSLTALVIRIGETNAALDELLRNRQSGNWAFITAYNPFSKLLTEEENEIRHANLIQELGIRNFHFLNGYGQSANGQWQAEPSVFVFNIDRETAIGLGTSFGQNAIVSGQINNVPGIVWCQSN